jgi:hypothetical protein
LINYTERLALLMRDIASRVQTLSFIDVADLLVFARAGRSDAEGAFATCHCLSLPASEPGYYFWRDRTTGQITRRSEWFVTKSPTVTIASRPVKYMFSFAVPRFCDQSLDRSKKERYYPGVNAPWIAKLDTVVHELYHIDPMLNGIRRLERTDGTYSANCHSDRFFEEVADMVSEYLDTRPDPSAYDFLRHDFQTLESRFGGVIGASFRTFPSYPQRFIEALPLQPSCDADLAHAEVEPVRPGRQPQHYSEDDLHIRRFSRQSSARLARNSAIQAA